MPIIADKLKFIPIGSITHSDADYDYVFQDIVIQCPNIVPRYIRADSSTIFDARIHEQPLTVLHFNL
jgi:hypothetical protein